MHRPIDRAEWFGEGDVVQVRSWDDMAEEFGSGTSKFYINLPRHATFINEMKKHCGKKFVIEQCYGGAKYGFYGLAGFDGWNPEFWWWSAEMLEPALMEKPYHPEVNPESLSCILTGGSGK